MKVDLRLFSYELEPAQNKLEWEKSKALMHMSKILTKYRGEKILFDKLEAHHLSVTKSLRRQLEAKFDPDMYQSALIFLDQLSTKIEDQKKVMQTIENEKQLIRKTLFNLQLKNDLFEEHKRECCADFVSVEINKQLSEIDREWSARAIWEMKMEKSV